MAVEQDYSWRDFDGLSHERLAEEAAHELVACGIAQLEQPQTGPGSDVFRLTSWVDGSDAKIGHALAISQPYPLDNEFIRSQFFCVDREDKRLIQPPKLMAVSLDVPSSNIDFEAERMSWTSDFDKTELALMLNMLGKAAGRFNGEEWPLDGDVQLTLAETNLDELASRYPENNNNRSEFVEHILEWAEFMATAKYAFRKTIDPSESYQETAMQYEHNSQLYAINLKGYYGNLTGMQILWQRHGVWQGRAYDFDPAIDEDDLVYNQPDPAWNREALLSTVRDGLRIPSHIFNHYMSETLSK